MLAFCETLVLNTLVFFFSEIVITSACLVENNNSVRVEWIVSTQITSGDFLKFVALYLLHLTRFLIYFLAACPYIMLFNHWIHSECCQQHE